MIQVTGGGPAGATAARLLAQWGHEVRLADAGPPGRRMESLPPSIRRHLQLLGILEAVDGAGFGRSAGNAVWWGAQEPRVEGFADAPGYHVARAEFDRLLRELAFAAGVTAGDGEAEWVLDCAGRTSARGRAVRRMSARRTVCLCAEWTGRFAYPEHTWIESYRDGWAWSAPRDAGARQVAVMVDYELTELERGRGVGTTYESELGKTAAFAALLGDAARAGEVWGCEATSYTSARFVDGRCLLVGDAGSAVDPLSSYGVRKAMGSAWLAAVVVHTCIRHPERRDLALGYYEERERQVFQNLERRTAPYFEQAGEHEFFGERAAPDEEPFYRQADLAEAWEALRSAESIRLRLAPGVTREVRAGIEGHEIVPREALAAPGLPAGLEFVQGVDLGRLVELAPEFSQVPDLFEAYNRGAQPVELPGFAGVLSLLVANGVLRNG